MSKYILLLLLILSTVCSAAVPIPSLSQSNLSVNGTLSLNGSAITNWTDLTLTGLVEATVLTLGTNRYDSDVSLNTNDFAVTGTDLTLKNRIIGNLKDSFPPVAYGTGTSYYVSSIHTNASDSNAGTSSTAPWLTMTNVMAQWSSLSAGDTVYIERGSQFDLTFSADWWEINNGGTSGNPMTLSGNGYGEGARPILKRIGGSGDCSMLLIQASYITVRDIAIDGGTSLNTTAISINANTNSLSNVNILDCDVYNLGGDASTYICGIWLASYTSPYPGISDCRIEGNHVSGYSAHGLNHYMQGTATNVVWRNNVVTNSYAGGRYSSANSALQIVSGGRGNVFEHNYLNDTTCDEGAVFMFGKYISDDGTNDFRYNVIANSGAYGFIATRDQDGYALQYDIYDNIIYGSTKSAIAIHPDDSYSNATFNIYNNTLFNNYTYTGARDTDNGSIEFDRASTNTTIDFVNNIVWHSDTRTAGLMIDTGITASVTHSNNLYYHAASTSAVLVAATNVYTVTNITSFEVSAKSDKPLFYDNTMLPTVAAYKAGASPNGLAQQSGSPALIGSATLSSKFGSDIKGYDRSYPWTLGAYQYQTSAIDSLIDMRIASSLDLKNSTNSSLLVVGTTQYVGTVEISDDFYIEGSTLKLTPSSTASARPTPVPISPAGGTAYYVSSIHTNASDSNGGTSSNAPWLTLGKVKDEWPSLSAGDTVYVERGSLFELNFSADWWEINGGGTLADGNITISGTGFGTGDLPKLIRTNDSTDCSFILIKASYVTVMDLVFDGGYTNGGLATSGITIGYGANVSNVNVSGCSFVNLGGDSGTGINGILVSSAAGESVSQCRIEGNTISDYSSYGLNQYPAEGCTEIIWRNNVVSNSFADRQTDNNGAMQIRSGGSGNVVDGNWFEDRTCTEAAVTISGNTDDTAANEFKYNVVAYSPVDGVGFIPNSAAKLLWDFYGNVMFENDDAAFSLYPGNTFSAGSVFKIYNNTFFDNVTNETGNADIDLDNNTTNCTIDFVNNIVYRTDENAFGLYCDTPFLGALTHSNNLYWNSVSITNMIVSFTNEYTVTNVTTFEASAQNTDPGLLDITNLPTAAAYPPGIAPTGLCLSAYSSVAYGNGADLGSPYNYDALGFLRSTPWTIGAYEFIITPEQLATNWAAYTAVQTLDMDSNNITNAGSVSATTYYGDGSQLTGVSGGSTITNIGYGLLGDGDATALTIDTNVVVTGSVIRSESDPLWVAGTNEIWEAITNLQSIAVTGAVASINDQDGVVTITLDGSGVASTNSATSWTITAGTGSAAGSVEIVGSTANDWTDGTTNDTTMFLWTNNGAVLLAADNDIFGYTQPFEITFNDGYLSNLHFNATSTVEAVYDIGWQGSTNYGLTWDYGSTGQYTIGTAFGYQTVVITNPVPSGLRSFVVRVTTQTNATVTTIYYRNLSLWGAQ